MTIETDILDFFDMQIEHFPDRSTRWLFEDPENVRGLLEIIIGDLVEQIDFDQIVQHKRSFVRDDLRELEPDLVFSVPFRSDPKSDGLLIYILIEHQSAVDPIMAFRFLFYITQIWDSQRRQWESENVPKGEWRFRPILPIVFYTGDRKWNAPLDLGVMMDVPEALSRIGPKFEPLLLDVKHTNDAELTKTDHPFGWLLTVMRKENATKEELTNALIETMSRINALDPEQAVRRRRAFLYLLLLVMHRRPVDEHGELRALVDQSIQQPEDRKEVGRVSQTMVEHLIESGEIRGEKRGLEQGATRAKREAVLTLLQLRFGSVPESLMREISSMRSIARLDSLFEKAVAAETIDEIDFQSHDA